MLILKKTHIKKTHILALSLAAILALAAAQPANAAKTTFTVTSLLDDGSVGTLRWAIDQAQTTNKAAIINFDSALAGQVLLTSPLPMVTTPLTINGNGNGIDGDTAYQIFWVGPTGNLTLNDVRLSYGLAGAADGFVGGGAVHNEGALTLNGCYLYGNWALGVGGAIANNNGSVTIVGGSMQGNYSLGNGSDVMGGAIYSVGGSLSISGVAFWSNVAISLAPDGGVQGYSGGGAIAAVATASSPAPLKLYDCEFYNNMTGQAGGAVWVEGGFDATLCLFRQNGCRSRGPVASGGMPEVAAGGALFAYGGSAAYPATLYRNIFFENAVTSDTQPALGGGACLVNLSVSAARSVFAYNRAVSTAPESGGGLSGSLGGGLLLADEPSVISDSLFIENVAGDPLATDPTSYPSVGGGIAGDFISVMNCTLQGNWAWAASAIAADETLVANTIVWDNPAGTTGALQVGLLFGSAPMTITYSDVQGCGGSGTTWLFDSLVLVDGAGNIDSDPLFGADFELSLGSPCIDAGSNAIMAKGSKLDLGGSLRISGKSVDMGAVEYQYPRKPK